MEKEEHPVFVQELYPVPKKAPAFANTQPAQGSALAKVVELMNARNPRNKAEADHSYAEVCKTLQKLHNEKTFVPPVCLT